MRPVGPMPWYGELGIAGLNRHSWHHLEKGSISLDCGVKDHAWWSTHNPDLNKRQDHWLILRGLWPTTQVTRLQVATIFSMDCPLVTFSERLRSFCLRMERIKFYFFHNIPRVFPTLIECHCYHYQVSGTIRKKISRYCSPSFGVKIVKRKLGTIGISQGRRLPGGKKKWCEGLGGLDHVSNNGRSPDSPCLWIELD